MVDIRHRIEIKGSPERVYEALATVEGLSYWWTKDVRGESEPARSLSFYFGAPEPSAVMEVLELAAPKLVEWRCVNGPDEWVGTHVEFALEGAGDHTVMRFAHTGWREPSDFMAHCSAQWAVHLLGLKNGLEGGRATPFPEEVRV